MSLHETTDLTAETLTGETLTAETLRPGDEGYDDAARVFFATGAPALVVRPRDPGEVDKYIADPLCGWDPSISMWRDVFDLIFADADDANFGAVRRDLPVFLVGGDKDPSTDGGKAVRHLYERMRRMGFSRTVMKINPGARHESLNDSNREAMMEDFVSWADEVLNPKGPAAGPPQGP